MEATTQMTPAAATPPANNTPGGSKGQATAVPVGSLALFAVLLAQIEQVTADGATLTAQTGTSTPAPALPDQAEGHAERDETTPHDPADGQIVAVATPVLPAPVPPQAAPAGGTSPPAAAPCADTAPVTPAAPAAAAPVTPVEPASAAPAAAAPTPVAAVVDVAGAPTPAATAATAEPAAPVPLPAEAVVAHAVTPAPVRVPAGKPAGQVRPVSGEQEQAAQNAAPAHPAGIRPGDAPSQKAAPPAPVHDRPADATSAAPPPVTHVETRRETSADPAATAPAPPAPLDRERFDRLVDGLAARLKLSHAGDGARVRMQLDPKELGEVIVRLEIRDGLAQASLIAENREAGRMLQSAIADLRSGLADRGVQLDRVEVRVAGDGRGDSRHPRHPNPHDHRQTPRGSHFAFGRIDAVGASQEPAVTAGSVSILA